MSFLLGRSVAWERWAMYLSHPSGVQPGNDVGSVVIMHPLWSLKERGLGSLAGLPWGAKFLSWLDCPSALGPILCTRPPSSTPDPPGSPLYSRAGRIMGEIYLKDTFSEGCQSWCVYWHNWLCIHKSLFILDFLVWNTAEAQKWEKVAFVTLATRHGELENSKKLDSLSLSFCQEISTHKPDIF